MMALRVSCSACPVLDLQARGFLRVGQFAIGEDVLLAPVQDRWQVVQCPLVRPTHALLVARGGMGQFAHPVRTNPAALSPTPEAVRAQGICQLFASPSKRRPSTAVGVGEGFPKPCAALGCTDSPCAGTPSEPHAAQRTASTVRQPCIQTAASLLAVSIRPKGLARFRL